MPPIPPLVGGGSEPLGELTEGVSLLSYLEFKGAMDFSLFGKYTPSASQARHLPPREEFIAVVGGLAPRQ